MSRLRGFKLDEMPQPSFKSKSRITKLKTHAKTKSLNDVHSQNKTPSVEGSEKLTSNPAILQSVNLMRNKVLQKCTLTWSPEKNEFIKDPTPIGTPYQRDSVVMKNKEKIPRAKYGADHIMKEKQLTKLNKSSKS